MILEYVGLIGDSSYLLLLVAGKSAVCVFNVSSQARMHICFLDVPFQSCLADDNHTAHLVIEHRIFSCMICTMIGRMIGVNPDNIR